jgi:hypothetical protein
MQPKERKKDFQRKKMIFYLGFVVLFMGVYKHNRIPNPYLYQVEKKNVLKPSGFYIRLVLK